MFSTSALAKATISSTSFSACAITGEAPAASRMFAVKFITTKFVMLCTSGWPARTASRFRAACAAQSMFVFMSGSFLQG
jgi:hypothetical protein